jgi:4-hydroxy-tetrahydrodipicolinate synthase
MALPAMSVGGHGLISVAANAFPEQMSRMIHTASESNIARAQALWADLEDVCRLLFAEGNPAGVKTALAVRGLCRADVRLPLVRGSERLRSAIEKAISTFV